MAKKTKLEPNDHVIRYVSWNKLRKDENDQVIGVLGVAFQRRDKDRSLSVTWLEYFPGNYDEQTAASIRAIRASKLDVKPKSGFVIGKVVAIQELCESRKYKVRFSHEPEDDNPAHASVSGLPRDDLALLESLALDAWCDVRLNSTVTP